MTTLMEQVQASIAEVVEGDHFVPYSTTGVIAGKHLRLTATDAAHVAERVMARLVEEYGLRVTSGSSRIDGRPGSRLLTDWREDA